MARIEIPVTLLEFDEGGTTIWVHGPEGATVLRIKAKKITSKRECQNICAHADIVVNDEICVCLPTKTKTKRKPRERTKVDTNREA